MAEDFDKQLHIILDAFFWCFHRHKETEIIVLAIEKFCSEGRPLHEERFRLFERDFIRKGVFDSSIFFKDFYVED